jgi:CRP-like cAMP-binding protein
MNNADILRQVPLFGSLTPEQIAGMVARFRVDAFAQDTIIFLEGDPADRFWIVQAGQVKIVKHATEGQENLLEVITPGEVFGGAAILFPMQPATAVAMTNTTTLSTERDQFVQLIRQYPDIAIRIINILGERLRAAMTMRALSTERVDVRLANILLKLCSKAGSPKETGVQINMPLSRQDLADMAGTTIETAIRIMSKFRKDGLVLTEPGGYIVVTDSERLTRLAEGT